MLWYIDAITKSEYPISFPAIAHKSYAGTPRRKMHLMKTAACHSKHILGATLQHPNTSDKMVILRIMTVLTCKTHA